MSTELLLNPHRMRRFSSRSVLGDQGWFRNSAEVCGSPGNCPQRLSRFSSTSVLGNQGRLESANVCGLPGLYPPKSIERDDSYKHLYLEIKVGSRGLRICTWKSSRLSGLCGSRRRYPRTALAQADSQEHLYLGFIETSGSPRKFAEASGILRNAAEVSAITHSTD